MEVDPTSLLGLLVALGGGLLVGIDRERRKGEGPTRDAIGLRTCMLASMSGAVAALLGTPALIIAGAAVIAFGMLSYQRTREADPGLTTEFALVATFLLGALAMTRMPLAAALFVVLAIVLAAKSALHRFARNVLSEDELADMLRLSAAILIVLPLLPDRAIDAYGVLNPRMLWLYAVLVMAINAAGYVALRMLGPGRGLALAGLLGGFVSSTATIAGMAQRSRADASLRTACISAALLSNIATIVQLALILLAVSPALLRELALALGAAAATAAAFGAFALWRARGAPRSDNPAAYGRPLALRHALLFAAIVSAALFASALLRDWYGQGGVLIAAAATGLADVHAAAVSVGQLATRTDLPPRDAALALCLAFATNSLLKCIAAATGGRAFAMPVIAGIVAIAATLVGVVFLTP